MKRKAVVLALVTEAFGGRGGVAAVTRDIAGAMDRIDDISEIDILPLRHAADRVITPGKVRQRPAKANRVSFVLAAMVTAVTRRPVLVYCDHLHLAPISALAARIVGARLVIHLHGIEIWKRPSLLRRHAIEAADLLLCVSRDTRQRALSHFEIPSERVVVLNNTCDIGVGGNGDEADSDTFAGNRSSTLLTVSRLDIRERYKGHEHVFDAMVSLRARGVELSYEIAGDGDDRSRLEELARARGLSEHVRFLGQVPPDDLPGLYRSSRVFVMPSSGEGFGIAFLEAMMMATPAVGLAKAGANDALSDGVIGIATTLEDLPEALLRAIGLSEAERRKGAERIRVRFGRERFDRVVERLWRRLIEPAKAEVP
jgi:phosphatidylinositol alpha-1,6-mannosyltransferase